MQHDVEKYLADVLEEALDNQQFVGTKSYDEYYADKFTEAAVERKFETIGEALNRLLRWSAKTATKIRDHGKFIAFRNIVIHGYDTVSDPIAWDVIQNKRPLLIEDVERLSEPGMNGGSH